MNLFEQWKKVFGTKEYVLVAGIFALLLYSLHVAISHARTLYEFSANGFFPVIGLFFDLFSGMYYTMELPAFISLVVIVLFFGMLVSLLLYKMNMGQETKTTTGILSIFSILFAVVAPGCLACGIGLASLLGLSAAIISFLPYDGLELSFLAILILGITIVQTTKNLNTCPISKK